MSGKHPLDADDVGPNKRPKRCARSFHPELDLTSSFLSNGVSRALTLSLINSNDAQMSFVPPKGDLKNLTGSPAPAAATSTDVSTSQSPSLASQLTGSAQAAALAAKRAEIAAKFSKMMASSKAASTPAQPKAPAPAPAPPTAALSDLQKRVAEAKKKVEAMAQKTAANPYMVRSARSSLGRSPSSSFAQTGKATPAPVVPGVSLHPLLSGGSDSRAASSSKDRYKPMAPKFATTSVCSIDLFYRFRSSHTAQANARAIVPTPLPAVKTSLEETAAPTIEEAKKNPYFDKRLGVESLAPKARKSRPLKFAQKGKYVNLAENLRAEARQNEIRERVLSMAQRTGMESVMDGTERRAKRPPPPEVEWWDAVLLPNETYEDLDNGAVEVVLTKEDPEKGISRYIQHPIKVPAPQDKIEVEHKPLALTTKERKKLRRTTRRAEQQDKQDRVRMGLLPPDPPKIKISNMMRVLTQEAVMDPTKVEARVRREMMQRSDAHNQANQDRKLTPEERAAKLQSKADKDADMGLHAAVYRIGHLAQQRNKFKTIKNAQQHQLTGAIIFSPKFVFVLVEGGEKAMRKYRHLLLERIDWSDEPPEHMPADADEDDSEAVAATTNGIAPGENYCVQVWSGMHRERAFDKLRLKSVVRPALSSPPRTSRLCHT